MTDRDHVLDVTLVAVFTICMVAAVGLLIPGSVALLLPVRPPLLRVFPAVVVAFALVQIVGLSAG